VTVKDFAKIADAAYTAVPTIGDPNSASRAIVTRDDADASAIVSFPGSDNVACWLADLDAEVSDHPGLGLIHKGFWSAWVAIKEQVYRAIEGCRTVTWVGHSLGAALAILAGSDYAEIFKKTTIYGFEPPRVSADGAIERLISTLKVDISLYQNGNDVVPDVPRILQNWQHPAPLIKIGKPFLPFANINDHEMSRVIKALA